MNLNFQKKKGTIKPEGPGLIKSSDNWFSHFFPQMSKLGNNVHVWLHVCIMRGLFNVPKLHVNWTVSQTPHNPDNRRPDNSSDSLRLLTAACNLRRDSFEAGRHQCPACNPISTGATPTGTKCEGRELGPTLGAMCGLFYGHDQRCNCCRFPCTSFHLSF